MTALHLRILEVPAMLGAIGAAVAVTAIDTPVTIALIGGGAVVIAQIVIAVSAARNARGAREEAKLAREAVVEAARLAAERDIKIALIGKAVDGQLTGARQEISDLRGELARIYPDDIRVQQQAVNAARDSEMQEQASAKVNAVPEKKL